jgi:hypothetical protein
MTRKALTFIYRNLTKNCFSVKYRGKVVDHFTHPVIFSGRFSVSAAGRERVRRENKKYVHAFIVTNQTTPFEHFYPCDWEDWTLREVTYNPYKNEGFVFRDTGEPAEGHLIVMDYPRVYTLTE